MGSKRGCNCIASLYSAAVREIRVLLCRENTEDPVSPTTAPEGPDRDESEATSRPVPTIKLPPLDGLSSLRSDKCSYCSWNGKPEELVERDFVVHPQTNPIQSSECIGCQLLEAILHSFCSARNQEGLCSFFSNVTDDGYYTMLLNSQRILLNIFTTADLHGTQFERCNIPRRTWTHDSLFQPSYKWAQRRISECIESHQSCAKLRNEVDTSFKPSRLLYVDSENLGGDVVLVEGHSTPPGSQYIALSYCWGGHEPECMTTAITVAKNMERISWSSLPATFQDAITFTRSLGIKYLWIDSMCIIQKDEEDWKKQAGQMFHVYRNAYVTLAAADGKSSTSRLRTMSTEDESVKVADLSSEQHRCPIYVRPLHFKGDPILSMSRNSFELNEWGSLFHRAWTYQERLISPRVLYFTKSEVIFNCFSAVACECGECELEMDEIPISQQRHQKARFFNAVIDTSMKPDSSISGPVEKHIQERFLERRRIGRVWRGMVEEYSRLQLSHPRDRLLALGAIAEQFSRVLQDETYLAGLWSGTLMMDLLWTASRRMDSPQKDVLCAPYPLPTWSWASQQANTTWDLWVWSVDDPTEDRAQVVKAECEYVDGNPFGLLKSSVLILRGRVMACSVEREAGQYVTRSFFYMDDGNPIKMNTNSGLVFFDGDSKLPFEQQKENVHLLELTASSQKPTRVYYYLILRREANMHGVYSKAGVMKNYLSWAGDKERGTIEDLVTVFEKRSVMMDCEIR